MPWLWEKDQQVFPGEDLQTTFRSLKDLVLGEVNHLTIEGQPPLYGVTVRRFRKACYSQYRKAAAVELRAHWNRLGLLDSSIIGIPADCCQELSPPTTKE